MSAEGALVFHAGAFSGLRGGGRALGRCMCSARRGFYGKRCLACFNSYCPAATYSAINGRGLHFITAPLRLKQHIIFPPAYFSRCWQFIIYDLFQITLSFSGLQLHPSLRLGKMSARRAS